MAMRKREDEVFPNAAAVDVGASSHWVAVPAHSTDAPVREFGAMTDDLNVMADWLLACGVDVVALESTGVYWISVYEVLEQRGLKVWLVDARQVKYVPGRKSDVQDWPSVRRPAVDLGKTPRAGSKARAVFDVRQHLANWAGADLTRINGLGLDSVMKILSEIGTDLSRFANVKHFCSWLGLCPATKISGGNPVEMGLPLATEAERRLSADSSYRSDFARAFGERAGERCGAASHPPVARVCEPAGRLRHVLPPGTARRTLSPDESRPQP